MRTTEDPVASYKGRIRFFYVATVLSVIAVAVIIRGVIHMHATEVTSTDAGLNVQNNMYIQFGDGESIRATAEKPATLKMNTATTWKIVLGTPSDGPCLVRQGDAGMFNNYQSICLGQNAVLLLPDGGPVVRVPKQRTCLDYENNNIVTCTDCSEEECLARSREKSTKKMTPEERELARKLRRAWEQSFTGSAQDVGGAYKCCWGTKPCWYTSSVDTCLNRYGLPTTKPDGGKLDPNEMLLKNADSGIWEVKTLK